VVLHTYLITITITIMIMIVRLYRSDYRLSATHFFLPTPSSVSIKRERTEKGGGKEGVGLGGGGTIGTRGGTWQSYQFRVVLYRT